MSKKINLSYLTEYDALDVKSWSGLGYYIAKSIENQNVDVSYLNNLYTTKFDIDSVKKVLYRGVGKRYDRGRSLERAKIMASKIEGLLNDKTDIVFSPGTQVFSYLQTRKPKVIYTDSTFAGMIDFYEMFTNLSAETIRNGNFLEKTALENCDTIVYSSDWAAKTAVDNYQIDPAKIRVVPFGANLESTRNLESIKTIVANKSKEEFHILFLSVDWKRKGGDKVVEIVSNLNKMGIKTILDVVGIPNIPLKNIPPFVHNHGYISKSTSDGQNKLNQLFYKSNLLVLPTLADCTPVVFSEANSFGLPAISTDVGGIPTIIKDDINGKTFKLTDTAETYAKYIYNLLTNRARYNELCYSSFNRYKEVLNWDVAGKSLTNIFRQLM